MSEPTDATLAGYLGDPKARIPASDLVAAIKSRWPDLHPGRIAAAVTAELARRKAHRDNPKPDSDQ